MASTADAGAVQVTLIPERQVRSSAASRFFRNFKLNAEILNAILGCEP